MLALHYLDCFLGYWLVACTIQYIEHKQVCNNELINVKNIYLLLRPYARKMLIDNAISCTPVLSTIIPGLMYSSTVSTLPPKKPQKHSIKIFHRDLHTLYCTVLYLYWRQKEHGDVIEAPLTSLSGIKVVER